MERQQIKFYQPNTLNEIQDLKMAADVAISSELRRLSRDKKIPCDCNQPNISCNKACCKAKRILLWETEVQQILEFLNRPQNINLKQRIIKLFASGPIGETVDKIDKTSNIPCIFLENDKCSIYSARPLICRFVNSCDANECSKWETGGFNATNGTFINPFDSVAKGVVTIVKAHFRDKCPMYEINSILYYILCQASKKELKLWESAPNFKTPLEAPIVKGY